MSVLQRLTGRLCYWLFNALNSGIRIMLPGIIITAGLAAFIAIPVHAESVQIKDVRIAAHGGKTRVAIDLTQRAEHKIFMLSNPHRVVVDIMPGRIERSALPLPPGTGSVQRIRSANRKDGTVRIVLDMVAPAKPRSFLLVPNGKQGNRLVIDLLPLGAPRVVKKLPKLSPPAVSGYTAEPAGRQIVIAIDAGHGGKDPGAAGPTGVREKDVVLRISRQLAAKINADPNLRAFMTRDGDRFVPLRKRMESARAAEADLFVSIHADAFRDRRVRGATVYVLSSKGATDEASKRLADRENAAHLIGGISLDDKDPTLASVLLDLSQNASLSASIDIGTEMLDEISKITSVRKLKVQQAPFLVLKSPDVPSVLIETAFISNPRDESNLGSRRYREKLATAMYEGISDYFQMNPPPGSRMTQVMRGRQSPAVVHVIRRGDTLSGIADRYRVPVRRIRTANNLHNDKIVVGRTLRIPATHET
jgi:N-acetylmuramoyl-L-alanine amidase